LVFPYEEVALTLDSAAGDQDIVLTEGRPVPDL
jgi:hypothetical protein